MERPTRVVVDCSTGITTLVELSDEEMAQRKIDEIASTQRREAQEAETQAKAAAKASAAVAVTLAQVVDSLVVQESQ